MGNDVHTYNALHNIHLGRRRRSKRRGLLATPLLLLLFSASAFGAGGDQVWKIGDAQAGKENAAASAVDSQGNVIITGYRDLADGNGEGYYTIRINAGGTSTDGTGVEWRASFGSAGSDKATAVAVDGDDNVIVTGYTTTGTNTDIYTIKYCNNGDPVKCGGKSPGQVIWEHAYNRTAGGNDIGTAVAVDASRNVYVGGYSQNAQGNDDYSILKYDAAGTAGAGNLLWQRSYDGSSGDQITAVAADATGVAATGFSSDGSRISIVTVKFGPDGTQLWTPQKYAAPRNASGKQVKLDGAGNVIVAGYASDTGSTDLYLVKYDGTAGTKLWEKAPAYSVGAENIPYGLFVDSAGDAYVTGSSWTLTGKNDIFAAKYLGPSGNPGWSGTKLFDSGSDSDDIPVAVIGDQAAEGGFYVTGYTISGTMNYFQTLKFKKDNGALLWHRQANIVPGYTGRPVGLGLASTGDVIVGGWSNTPGNDYDYYAVRYDYGAINAPTWIGLSAASPTSLKLEWFDNTTDESGFEIKRCSDEAMTDSCTVITASAAAGTGPVSYTDTGLANNTYYFYEIAAFKGSNPKTYSNFTEAARALTVYVSPAAPSWSYTYDGQPHSDDYANAIAVGNDNNPVATGVTFDYYPGTSTGSTSFNFFTVKLDRTTRGVVWSNYFDDMNNADDELLCLAIDGNDNVTVSGSAVLFNGVDSQVNSIYSIAYPKLGPSGTELWHKQYNGPVTDGAVNDTAVASVTDSGNNVIVLGKGINRSGNEDIYLVKYQSNGTRTWEATPFDGAAHGNDIPTAVAVNGAGDVFISGYTQKAGYSPARYNFFAAKYSAAGQKIWSDELSPTSDGDNKAFGVAVDSDGDVYVTGYATNSVGKKNFYTVKYDGTATSAVRKWQKSIVHGDDVAAAVKIDPYDDPVYGSIVVAGTSLSNPDDHDITIARYHKDGTLIGSWTLNRPGFDEYVKGVALDSQGNINVTADSRKGGVNHGITVKFGFDSTYKSTTGYNVYPDSDSRSLLPDDTVAVAANSLDEVFVAGSATGAGGNRDFLVYKLVPEAAAPKLPTSFSAAPSYYYVNLAWADSSAVRDGFRIQRHEGACSPASVTATWADVATPSASAVSYTDSGLSTDTTYCYRIQTKNLDTASRWRYATASTAAAPQPPTITCTAASTTEVSCSWTDTTITRTGFRLFRCDGTGGNCTQAGGDFSSSTLAYTDSAACPSTTYTYKVMTFGNGWETTLSAPSSPPAITSSAPSTGPAGLTATRVSEVAINLAWTYTTGDETGFHIERCSYDPATESACTNFALHTTLTKAQKTYQDGSLTPRRAYRYRVRAYKTESTSCSATGEWNTPYSGIAEATTTLLAPVLATPVAVDTTSISLNWTDNTASDTGFSLERCTGESCDFSVLDAGFPSARPTFPASFTDTVAGKTAAESVSYRYRIRATGNPSPPWPSDYSAVQTIAPRPIVLPSMTSATAVSEGKITVVWSNSTNTDVNNVQVYRCETAGGSCIPTVALSGLLPATQTSYDDTTVVSGTTYYYLVHAIKTGKWDRASANTVSATPLAIAAPVLAVPTQFDTTTIRLEWTENLASETGFTIERCTGEACAFAPLDTGFPATVNKDVHTYTDATATNGTTYRYRVQATGTPTPPWPSGYSNIQNATAKPIVLPSMTSATAGSESTINVSWTNSTNTDVNNVQLYRCENAGAACTPTVALSGLLPASQASFVDTTAVSGKTYYYQIHAIKTGKWDKASANTVSAAPLAITAPVLATPTAVDTTTIKLDWTENLSAETGFKVERCTGATCDFATLDTGFPATVGKDVHTYSDAATLPGPVYRYRVYATGTPTPPWPSGYSTIQNASSKAVVPPSMVSATAISEARIDIVWTNSTNTDATGVQIYRCAGDGCTPTLLATTPATLPATQTNYSDNTVTLGNVYYYQVHALKSGKWDVASINTKSASTQLAGPTTFTCTTSADNTTNVTCSWKDTTTSETGFELQRFTGATATGTPQTVTVPATDVAGNTATISYNDTTASAATQYTYRVRAVNGTVPWTSEYSTTYTVTTPTPVVPVVSAARLSESGVRVTWTGSSPDATGYRVERCTGAAGVCPVADTTGKFTQAGSDLPAASRTFDDTGLAINTTCTYRVKAFKTTGGGNGWTVTGGTASATPGPLAPTLSVTGTQATQVTLAWNDTAVAETNYRLQRCNGTDCRVFNLPADTVQYIDSAVLPLTTYTYRAMAVNDGLSSNGGGTWAKRVKLAIAGFQPEYQTKYVVNYTSEMKSDFSDLRFYDADANAELPYWVESKTDGASATLWFKTRNSGNIYLYYGNPNATSASSIRNTFIFGDDFSAGTSQWELGGTQAASLIVEDGQAHLTGAAPTCYESCYYGCYTYCDSVNFHASTTSTISLGTGVRMDMDINKPTGANNARIQFTGTPAVSHQFNDYNSSTAKYVQGVWSSIQVYSCDDYYGCGWSPQSIVSYGTVGFANGWQAVSTVITPTSVIGTYRGDVTPPLAVTLPGDYSFKVMMVAYADNVAGVYFDNVRVRKYAATEPSVTISGTPEIPPPFTGTWDSGYGDSVMVTTLALTPPDGLSCTPLNTTEVNCAWNDRTLGETATRIERCSGSTCDFSTLDAGFPVSVGENVHTYTDRSASHATVYKYRVASVRTVDPAWTSAYSNTSPTETVRAYAPEPMTATAVSASRVDLAWTDKTGDESGFRVERCSYAADAGSCSDFVPVAGGTLAANAVAYSDQSLTGSTSYCYRVSAYKTATNGWDLPTSGSCTKTFPEAPSNLRATPLNSFKVKLTWSQISPDEDGFRVQKKAINGVWIDAATITANPTAGESTYIDSLGNEPQKTFLYRVKAYRGAVESAVSNEVSATTPAYVDADNSCDHTLTVTTSGPGTINVIPQGVTCPAGSGSTCNAYCAGTEVKLQAWPESGAAFTGWGGTGACSGTGSTCTIVIYGDHAVTGAFSQ